MNRKRRLTQTHTGFLVTSTDQHWENSNLDVCALTNALESGANCSSLRLYNNVNRNSRTCAWCEGSVQLVSAIHIRVLYRCFMYTNSTQIRCDSERKPAAKTRHYAIDKTRTRARAARLNYFSQVFLRSRRRGLMAFVILESTRRIVPCDQSTIMTSLDFRFNSP